ncbi:signal peptidase I [Ureibacillus thermophilus]|uniref:Signal peptidase I n=1 Tax=Ureibacillus thermophilus TaxID=367743 RepID=A0A4P6USR2_9BACL|nr:signal peptidase I [Ureibacillus thermophilus]QBK26134.1 signal peptidase I [Ureibacillus thermophilus]
MTEKKFWKECFSWLFVLATGIAFAFIIKQYVFSPIIVNGASMFPTYEDKDVIIVSKISEIERFDHVVFKAPYEDEYYIKRVIGLPGDTIEMKDDVLIINGKEYEEPYVNRTSELNLRVTEDFTLEELTGEKTVPEGSLFVLGDNRLKSFDSRHFGLIPIDDVYGESKIRIFPLQNIKVFYHPYE